MPAEFGASRSTHWSWKAMQGIVSPKVMMYVEPMLPMKPRSRMSGVLDDETLPRNLGMPASVTGLLPVCAGDGIAVAAAEVLLIVDDVEVAVVAGVVHVCQ